MSDIGITLRRVTSAYSGSYPDWVTNPPTPTLASLAPASIVVDTPTPVTLTGTNFTPASRVYADEAGQLTQYVSATQLRYVAEASAVGAQDITVHNGGTAISNASVLTVTATVGGTGTEPPPAPAPAPTTDYLSITGEQVAGWTVDEAKGFVEANPDLADAVLAYEQAGRARATLVPWLEDFITARDAPT